MFLLKEKIKEQLNFNLETKISRTIDKLLDYAVGADAAEICFEPEEKELAVIFRIADGTENVFKVPKKTEPALLGGLKEIARVHCLAENSAGRGEFKKEYQGFKIIFSLAVHPTDAGERITIDLHKEKFELLEVGRLGLNTPALAAVKKNLNKKKGLTLVVGNFNSGRTTTLYSFINFINKPELNVATVESEIAFDIPQINQSCLDPISGHGLAAAINSLRRQDADAAMIGEINDKETAEAAMRLAEGGRFVLCGLYSRNAATALAFFHDLSVPEQLFNATARMVISQKLLKKNCPHCLTEQKISAGMRQRLEESFALESLLRRMHRDKIISKNISGIKDLVFYKSRGCAFCKQAGFLGRIGIFEVLEITPEVKKIIKEGHFSGVRGEIKKQGGYLMEEDALMKALSGLTSPEEVFKVVED